MLTNMVKGKRGIKISPILASCMLIATCLMVSSCNRAPVEQPTDEAPAITVTDFRGETLSFQQEPKRIVCLIESALTGLYMLGVEDRVVGVSTNIYQQPLLPYYSQLDPRIKDKKIPTPGNWDFVNVESVAALSPDLVIIWADQKDSIQTMENLGIPVYGVFINTFADIEDEIRDLGALTGAGARAEEIIEYVKVEKERFSANIAAMSDDANQPGVYFMWSQSVLDTAGKPSTVNELIEMAGARNVASGISQEHTVVNMEKIIEWNPDVIVMWYNEKLDPADVAALPGWSGITAVRENRIFELPGIFQNDLWTLKYVNVVKMLAKWSYSEKFEDVNLPVETINMYDTLYGSGRITE